MLLLLASLILLINAAQYCPSANDLVVAYYANGPNSVILNNQGWTINGGGGAATAASFNILGGQVDFDIDFTNTGVGVNGNIYTISPNQFTGPFSNSKYCDGQGANYWCEEIDWIESNGNCGAATTIHTTQGGSTGCNAGGCHHLYSYNGKPKFHMTISYALDGTMTVFHDNIQITQSMMSPVPRPEDTLIAKNALNSKGAVIYSSLWTGWVPSVPGGCSGSGSLQSSSFTVSNLQISGNVVSGPIPTLCASQAPIASPPFVPPVAPQPPPVAAPTAPVPTSPAGTCQIAGGNNNYYYTEVQSVAGATVTITCSGQAGTTCSPSQWGDNTYYQCWLPNGCNNPTPSCSIVGQNPPPVTPPPVNPPPVNPPPVNPPPVNPPPVNPPPVTPPPVNPPPVNPPPVNPPPVNPPPVNPPPVNPPPVNPPPVNPPPVTPPPTTGSSSTCSFTGSNNNPYYMEIRATVGATVSVTCGSGQGANCQLASWDNTFYQCWPQNCQNPTAVCSSAPPPPPPTTGSGSTVCRFEGSNNGPYYMEVRSSVGAAVSITCSSGTGTNCQLTNWDNTYFQCWTQNCQNPTPHCTVAGHRMEGEEDAATGSSLPGWAIGIIVVGSVLFVASVFLGVILYTFFQKANQQPIEV